MYSLYILTITSVRWTVIWFPISLSVNDDFKRARMTVYLIEMNDEVVGIHRNYTYENYVLETVRITEIPCCFV